MSRTSVRSCSDSCSDQDTSSSVSGGQLVQQQQLATPTSYHAHYAGHTRHYSGQPGPDTELD